jgi:hypothetical protein
VSLAGNGRGLLLKFTILTYVCITVFLYKKVLECKEWPKIRLKRGGVSHTNAMKKRFQNAVPACVLLRKNLQSGIPSQEYPCVCV